MAVRISSLCLVVALVVALGSRTDAVDFAACADFEADDGAECTTIAVLEDRSKPDGRTLDLHVVVLRARSPEPRAPLFLLAGGPGLGATALAEIALGPYAGVREIRDVVLVDQRGTGQSNPLDCPYDAEDPAKAFGHLFDPQEVAACSKQASKHADLRLYGTQEVVEDLEEVCDRLGYAHVVLWGGSGGTRTALVWLREHPERIEAVALDGVVPMDFRAPSGYARSAQEALDRVFDDCAAQASCKAAYPDLRGDFDKLLHRFDTGPVETHVAKQNGERVPVSMHRGDFGYAVRGILYRSASTARLPTMIHEAARTGDLQPFAQAYWERDAGLRPLLAIGVHLSVFGTEDVPFIDRETIASATDETYLGTYLVDTYTAACAAWNGRGVLPAGFHDPVRARVPVLLVSGAYDPVTPPPLAAAVARNLPSSRHIVVPDEGHGAGFGCAREVVVEFLKSGSLENLGPACENVGPIRFEVPEAATR